MTVDQGTARPADEQIPARSYNGTAVERQWTMVQAQLTLPCQELLGISAVAKRPILRVAQAHNRLVVEKEHHVASAE